MLATREAYKTVLSMANSSSAAQILAQTAPTSAPLTSDQSAEPAFFTQLRNRANTACFIDKNPQQCSYWSQMYASADVARSYPGGDIYKYFDDAKKAGSLDAWLRQPTWVSPARASTLATSSLAVVMSANNPAQTL